MKTRWEDLPDIALRSGYTLKTGRDGHAVIDPAGEYVDHISPGYFHAKGNVLDEARRIVREHLCLAHKAVI